MQVKLFIMLINLVNIMIINGKKATFVRHTTLIKINHFNKLKKKNFSSVLAICLYVLKDHELDQLIKQINNSGYKLNLRIRNICIDETVAYG